MATTPTSPARHFPAASRERPRQRTSRQRLRQLVRTHPLGAFFGVTFAFSWVCEIVAFGVLDLDFVIGVFPAIWGPALGAYVVIRPVTAAPVCTHGCGDSSYGAWIGASTCSRWELCPGL